MMNISEENITISVILSETVLTRYVKFIPFVILIVPAVICNIISVYYLMIDRILRRSIYNHGILALLLTTLLTNLIEVPRIIHYLHLGVVIPQSEINCQIWQWCDFLLFSTLNMMMLWISIERYLLIFHGSLFRTVKDRFFYHYLPLIVIVVYMLLFYIVALFIYPCEHQYDFNLPLCGYPCYTSHKVISMYDFITHTFIPIFIGIFVDILLIIRVIYRKRVGLQNQQQGGYQSKHRRMVIQVLSISCLYFFLQGSFTGVLFVQLFTVLPDSIIYVQTIYFYYFFWLLTLLLPFVCIGCLPEVTNKLKSSFKRQFGRNITVLPIATVELQNRTILN